MTDWLRDLLNFLLGLLAGLIIFGYIIAHSMGERISDLWKHRSQCAAEEAMDADYLNDFEAEM